MPPAKPQSANDPSSQAGLFLGPLLLLLMAFELLALFLPSSFADWGAGILVFAMPLVGLKRLRAREFYLIGVSVVLLLFAWFTLPDLGETLLRGLERASFLAAFILLMGLLREGGITSPAVRDCGAYITQQPPRRRFLAVFLGGHFFSVLINLGALSLLALLLLLGALAAPPASADTSHRAPDTVANGGGGNNSGAGGN